MSPVRSKQFKAKNVPAGNASKNTSKGRKGVSRTKKASPALLEMLKRANAAPFRDEARQGLDDKVLEEMGQELKAAFDQATTKEEKDRALENHDRRMNEALEHLKMRYMFLNIIEIAKQGDINYLRECAECSNIFFAGRKDQGGCSTACLAKIRKKRWKRNYAEAKEGKRRGYLKTKRAKTARKR